MRSLIAAAGVLGLVGPLYSANAQKPAEPCIGAEVLTCGIKDGRPKAYPNVCAAIEDGARHIRPKQAGKPCPFEPERR